MVHVTAALRSLCVDVRRGLVGPVGADHTPVDPAADRRLAEWKPMSNFPSRHPVTVTQLPRVRGAVCRRTVAHRPGEASAVLTKHYQKAHPELVHGD